MPLVRAVLENGQDGSQVRTVSEDLGRDVKEENEAQTREECGWWRSEVCVFPKTEMLAMQSTKMKHEAQKQERNG